MNRFEETVANIEMELRESHEAGVDIELVLATVLSKHFKSDEKCDSCHLYGVTFAEKLNRLMS